jgi:hypothetical protein
MKPSVFIASSEEALKVAEAIQEHLRATADCQIWTQDAFRPSGGTLDSLLNLVGDHDFGIFVFSPDDKMTIRSKDLVSPRDNVIFEAGLFMGRYGRVNVFVVSPENVPDFRVPTDLRGFTTVPYDPKHSKGLLPGTAPAARQIRDAIEESGIVRRLVGTITLRVVSPAHKVTFPLKIWLELRNDGGVDVVLHSGFFRFDRAAKPHPKLRGSAGGLEADLFFPGKDNTHTEREYLLKSRASVTTFTALSPDLDATRIQALMANNKVGVFNITGCWLGDTPTVRRYRFPV